MKNKKKSISLFVHHFASMELRQKPAGRQSIFGFVFSFCYKVGLGVMIGIKFLLWILRICLKATMAAGNGIRRAIDAECVKTKNMARQRLLVLKQKVVFQSLMTFILLSTVTCFFFFGGHLMARAIQIKNNAFSLSFSGKQYLQNAEDALKTNDLPEAQKNFGRALSDFESGKQEIADAGLLIDGISSVFPQKRAGQKLLDAAAMLSRAGGDVVSFYSQIQQLSFTPQGVTSQQPVSVVASSLGQTLSAALSEISRAKSLVDEVSPDDLPQNQQQALLQLKSKLGLAASSFQNVSDIFNFLANLCTGEKQLLIMFQNNNELRPSGGFLGTYGDFKLSNCGIVKQHISSIYDLDGQLRDVIKPPTPILNVNDRWYLRDSNWFADFPTTAKKISQFYEREGGETPDVVIAMDPSLLVDLLKITGPVALDEFKTTLNSDNFIEQTQALTSDTFDSPTNEPKQMLATFFPILLQKLFGLNAKQAGSFLLTLQTNLNAKHILLYSRDNDMQQIFSSFHWDGSVQAADRDYLQIVSSNLGGTKTDLYVDESVSLQTTFTDDGILNQVSITRTNKMPAGHGTTNVSFLRILVPEGSQLISDLGFDYKNIPNAPDPHYEIDDDVYAWEKNSVSALVTGTLIGQESGKTYFGNWSVLEGGQTKTITITYKLPFALKNIDKYSLLLQKQPGSIAFPFVYSVHYGNAKLQWNNFENPTLSTSDISIQFPLAKDYFLGMVIKK